MLLRYLDKWEEGLNKNMWDVRSVTMEQVHFMKGQMYAVKTMKRLSEEIKQSIELLRGGE
jgi:hypothetical protein